MSGWYRKRHSDGAKNEKTTVSYPNTSGHWLRNLSHRNARLKINSMDGLSGMAYAEVADWTRSSQTLFVLLDDSRRVIYIKLIRGAAGIPRKLEANLLLLGLVSQNGRAWLQAVVIKRAKAAPLWKTKQLFLILECGSEKKCDCVRVVCRLLCSSFVFATCPNPPPQKKT